LQFILNLNNVSSAMLNFQVQFSGPKICMLHGFTQNRFCFDPLIKHLPRNYQYVIFDLPGHGESPIFEDYNKACDEILKTAGRGIYLGYSMGARFVLNCYFSDPQKVIGLILISPNPGIVDKVQRNERLIKDHKTSEAILQSKDLMTFLSSWIKHDLFSDLNQETALLNLRAKSNSPKALSEASVLYGLGTFPPLWEQLADILVPVLIITGKNDKNYGQIAKDMKNRISNCCHIEIPDAYHSPQLSRPKVCAEIISEWLYKNNPAENNTE
jgi:2-succinyl-6-hydroxy-2,4-cyclohexadiene-1-carboxylate synthase